MRTRLREALSAHAGGLLPTFWWLWAGALVNSLASFVFPFLALFLTSRGFAPRQAGLVVSLFGLGALLAAPLGGHLADRVGRRPTILAGLVGAAAMAALLAFLRSPAAIGTAVFLFGLCLMGTNPPFFAAIADVVPAERRGRALGLAYWANNLGIGISLVLGGTLAAAAGWALPFLADAGTTLLFALVVFRRVPETRPGAATRGGDDGSAGLRALLGDGAFLAFLALHLLFAVVFWQMQSSAPIDMAAHGLSPRSFGLVLAVNTALIVVLQPFAGRLLAAMTPARALALASLLVGLGYGAYGLCRTAPQYALATALWTLGEIVYMPTAGALVAELAPPSLRGRYVGAYSLGFGAASFLAPLLGPALLQAAGAATLWGACLALCAAVAVGHLALGRARTRALEHAAGRPAATSPRSG